MLAVVIGQMPGQAVKKKLATVMRPSRAASVTVRPCWSVRENAGMAWKSAGTSAGVSNQWGVKSAPL